MRHDSKPNSETKKYMREGEHVGIEFRGERHERKGSGHISKK